MAVETKIQWCDHTFNPWRGCTKISAGCTNCYAETMSKRNPGTLGVWGDMGTRVIASEAYWAEPLKWNRKAAAAGERRKVFCASMADVFEDRPELVAPRHRLAKLIEDTPNLDWLILTKRPENFRRLWPLSVVLENVWLGVSVEDQQRADERIPLLLQTPAAVRFISAEPLLSRVDFCGALGLWWNQTKDAWEHEPADRSGVIDWVIVGGESGPRARPCDLAWIRGIVGQCKAAAVACFVKQLGDCAVTSSADAAWSAGNHHSLGLQASKGGDPEEWPEDLRVREFPR